MKNLKIKLATFIVMVLWTTACVTVQDTTNLSINVKTDKGELSCKVGLVINADDIQADTVCSGVFVGTDGNTYLCKNISLEYVKAGNILKTDQDCEIVVSK